MALALLLTPLMQIGYEIRYELAAIVGTNRTGERQHRMRNDLPLLPEQRPEELRTIECRKAEAVLRSVRHGAVRR